MLKLLASGATLVSCLNGPMKQYPDIGIKRAPISVIELMRCGIRSAHTKPKVSEAAALGHVDAHATLTYFQALKTERWQPFIAL
jgi:hypothetical protein